MLYVVEIRREQEQLTAILSAIREWLDNHRFEPDAFRCTADQEGVTCHLEFKFESEATACANAFGGEIRRLGHKPRAGP
jgi:hypothetical protein